MIHCRKITASDVARLTRKEMINDYSPNDIPDRRRSLSDMQSRQTDGDRRDRPIDVLCGPAGVVAEDSLKELIEGPVTEAFEQ